MGICKLDSTIEDSKIDFRFYGLFNNIFARNKIIGTHKLCIIIAYVFLCLRSIILYMYNTMTMILIYLLLIETGIIIRFLGQIKCAYKYKHFD